LIVHPAKTVGSTKKPFCKLPPGDRPPATAFAFSSEPDAYVVEHALLLFPRHERPHFRFRVESVAQLHAASHLGKAGDEFVVDAALDE
jgi:hypothetical protein